MRRNTSTSIQVPNPTTVSTFFFNPYDAPLDLTDKEDRKLYQEACKGIKNEDRFDGKRENYGGFAKLIEPQLKDVRLMEALQIPTEWNSLALNIDGRRLPFQESTIDILRSHKVTEEQVSHYCDLV